ncbi:MAG: hypothetical protein JOY89_18540 [Solirubrobacterales bacterium]|nr:hypothetical protein [Solirubrobacterales bacterium]
MPALARPPRAVAFAGLLAAGLLLAGGGRAKAETIDFTLQGVTFDDGGTASGGFVVNAATGTVQSVDLVTTAGSRLGGTTYTQVTQQPSYFADTPYSFLSQNGNYISLSFQHALTTAGADPIVTTVGRFGIGESYECDNCATYRAVTGGQAFGLAVGGPDGVVTGDPIGVPEPISLAAFGTSLLGLGLARAASKR